MVNNEGPASYRPTSKYDDLGKDETPHLISGAVSSHHRVAYIAGGVGGRTIPLPTFHDGCRTFITFASQ